MDDSSAVRRHYAELHLSVLLFGGASLFGKLINLGSGPIVLVRSLVGALLVAMLARAFGHSLTPRRRFDLAVFFGLGTVLALHWMAFFRAVQVSTVSIAVVSVATFPVFTALGKPLAAGRRPQARDAMFALVALAGVALMVDRLELGQSSTQGVLWGVLAAALFALLTVANERLVADYPSQTVACYQYTVAAVVLAPAFASGLGDATTKDWLLLVLLGTVFTGVAHTLFISSMRGIRSETASLTVSLEPAYGVSFAWLLLDEVPTPRIVGGAALILTAVIVGSRQSTTNVAARPR